MSPSLLLRVCVVSLALSVFSFVAGMAGDFSRPAPVSGVAVVVPIPPAISAADRAGGLPLPALPRTAAAEARTLAKPIRIASASSHRLAPADPLDVIARDHESAHSALGAEDAAERIYVG